MLFLGTRFGQTKKNSDLEAKYFRTHRRELDFLFISSKGKDSNQSRKFTVKPKIGIFLKKVDTA